MQFGLFDSDSGDILPNLNLKEDLRYLTMATPNNQQPRTGSNAAVNKQQFKIGNMKAIAAASSSTVTADPDHNTTADQQQVLQTMFNVLTRMQQQQKPRMEK